MAKRSSIEIVTEVDKLNFMNENLLLIQKKKDDILEAALNENQKLRDENKELKIIIQNKNKQIEELMKTYSKNGLRSKTKKKSTDIRQEQNKNMTPSREQSSLNLAPLLRNFF